MKNLPSSCDPFRGHWSSASSDGLCTKNCGGIGGVETWRKSNQKSQKGRAETCFVGCMYGVCIYIYIHYRYILYITYIVLQLYIDCKYAYIVPMFQVWHWSFQKTGHQASKQTICRSYIYIYTHTVYVYYIVYIQCIYIYICTVHAHLLIHRHTYCHANIYLSTYLIIYKPTYLATNLPTYLSIYPSIYPSVCLSICLSVYLSICLSDYLFIYLSVCLSVCLSIYQIYEIHLI